MENYEEALFEEIFLEECGSNDCEVVCTYMYGYCGDTEGWGSTYCSEWGSSSTDDDDSDNND